MSRKIARLFLVFALSLNFTALPVLAEGNYQSPDNNAAKAPILNWCPLCDKGTLKFLYSVDHGEEAYRIDYYQCNNCHQIVSFIVGY